MLSPSHKDFIEKLAMSSYGVVYNEPDYDDYLSTYSLSVNKLYAKIFQQDAQNIKSIQVINTLFEYYLKYTSPIYVASINDIINNLPNMEIDQIIQICLDHDIERFIKNQEKDIDYTKFMFLQCIGYKLAQEIVNRYENVISLKYSAGEIDFSYAISIMSELETKVLKQGYITKSHLLFAFETVFLYALRCFVLIDVAQCIDKLGDLTFEAKLPEKIQNATVNINYLVRAAANKHDLYPIIQQYYQEASRYIVDLRDSYEIMIASIDRSIAESVNIIIRGTNSNSMRRVYGAQKSCKTATILLLKKRLFQKIQAEFKNTGQILTYSILNKQICDLKHCLQLFAADQLRSLLKLLLSKEKSYADALFYQPENIRLKLIEYLENIKSEIFDKPIYDRTELDRAYIRKHDQELFEYVDNLVGMLNISKRSNAQASHDVTSIYDIDQDIVEVISIERAASKLSFS